MNYKLLLIPAVLVLAGCSQSYLVQADKEFDQMRYSKSAQLYEKYLKGKEDLKAREKLAQAYLNMKNYKQAEKEYMKIVTSKNADPTSVFNYAKTLMLTGNYERAEEWMNQYMLRKADDKNAQYFFSNIKQVRELQKDSGLIRINPLAIKDQECSFSCAPFKKGIVFTAAVKSNEAKHTDPWTGTSFYNLYYAEPSANGEWTKPQPLKGELNNQYHESTPLFSKSGNEIIFTRSNYTAQKLKKNKENVSHLKLFSAKLINDEWKELKELPINSEDHSNGHPAFFKNEKALIFASDRPGGFGGSDLYVSYKTAEGYSNPENLGATVNTAGDEVFPWYDEKDSTLYFSSEGHLNLGGLDVFKSKYLNNSWQKPVNIGFPINSHTDDFSFVMNPDHKSGFVSSDRVGNDKIYEFKVEEVVINLLGRTKLKGGDELPLAEVIIEVTNKMTGEKHRYTSGLEAGFKVKLQPDMDYKIFATKEDYYSSKPIEVSTKGIKRSQNIVTDFELEKIVLEKPIVVENMYYDLGKWDIKPEAKTVLDGLVEFLTENPNIIIELSSHTDSRAGDQYNMKLSEKRAQSAVAYIISKGISASRLKSKGYGETKLLNKCKNGVKCAEEEHALNRRTEFKVIKVEKSEVNPFSSLE